MRIFVELIHTGLGTKIECLPHVLSLGERTFGVDFHTTNRIMNNHVSPTLQEIAGVYIGSPSQASEFLLDSYRQNCQSDISQMAYRLMGTFPKEPQGAI
jgi:hypothetical protein